MVLSKISFFLLIHAFFLISLVELIFLGSALCAPCFPSDPHGDNPDSLCLTYPTHGLTINSDSFRQGFASEAYYGDRLGPRLPGTPVEKWHDPGTPIDPGIGSANANGYWTRAESKDGIIRIETSSMRSWRLKPNK